MNLLEGKTVLVTGASKGIGNGIAKKCAEAGANVAFTYLSSIEKQYRIRPVQHKTIAIFINGNFQK